MNKRQTGETSTEYFYQPDLVTLITRCRYASLANPGSSERFLGKQVSQAKAFSPELSRYPTELREELDFIYRTLDGLSIYGPDLIRDLTKCSWRGYVVAAWLTILNPSEECCAILDDLNETAPNNSWFADLAKNSLTKTRPVANQTVFSLAMEFKSIIKDLTPRTYPIRKPLNATQIKAYQKFREDIRTKYQEDGLDKAIVFLSNSEFAEFFMSYDEWRRN